jgi:deoxyribose-phosphate aldolase
MVGVKPAGGIRTSKDAIKFLVAVNEVAGEAWLTNDWFRFGAVEPAQRPHPAAPADAHRRLLRPDYVADDSPSLY